MKILIILGVVLVGIALFLILAIQFLRLKIDTKCYSELLETKELSFPVLLTDAQQKEFLSRPLCLFEVRQLVHSRVPTYIEQYVWKLVEPFQIIGIMLLIAGNVSWFGSFWGLILAILSVFVVPSVVFAASMMLLFMVEEVCWKSINKKYQNISE